MIGDALLSWDSRVLRGQVFLGEDHPEETDALRAQRAYVSQLREAGVDVRAVGPEDEEDGPTVRELGASTGLAWLPGAPTGHELFGLGSWDMFEDFERDWQRM